MRGRAIIGVTLLLCLGGLSVADSISWEKTVTDRSFEFGKSKIVVTVDGRRADRYPTHTLTIYLDGAVVAKYPNVGFQQIHASKDHRHFVGLSNTNLTGGTAFVVFDAEGRLFREEKHRFMPPLMYTTRSAGLIAEVWFDEKKPDVTFEGGLQSVLVRGSNGRRYNLLKRDFGVER